MLWCKEFLRSAMKIWMPLVFLTMACLSTCPILKAQERDEDHYTAPLALAQSDSNKIVALARLSEYYFVQGDENKGDSVLTLQIIFAEESRNPNLILYSLFYNSRFQYISSFGKYEIDKSFAIVQRALDYARLIGFEGHAALAYARLSELYSIQGKMDLAFQDASTAFTTALHTSNDSIKVICGLQLGDIYLQQGDILMAFKTYTNAYDYANTMHNVPLLSDVYHRMSELFKKLGDFETAKDYVLKSLEVNRSIAYHDGILGDYIAFGRLHEYETAIIYLSRAELMADSLNNFRRKYQAQQNIFIQNMIHSRPEESLRYLDNHPQVKKYFKNKGPGQLEWRIAEVFLYRDYPDSAMHYFNVAEPYFRQLYDYGEKVPFYYELAICYDSLKNVSMAIRYFQEAMEFAKITRDIYYLRDLSASLKRCYIKQGDYQQALNYDKLYDQYTESVNLAGKDKELALLQIDNENKRRIREEELARAKERRQHDIQYMGMTIAIALAFVLLVTLGMFTVSRLTIRIMAFFSFILLFEFIILILDNYIHHITHGEPLKVWGIKIVLISMLFPLHHFMEDKLIHYLVSRKLITLRSRFSLKRLIFGEHKKPGPPKPDDKEEMTGIKEVIAE